MVRIITKNVITLQFNKKIGHIPNQNMPHYLQTEFCMRYFDGNARLATHHAFRCVVRNGAFSVGAGVGGAAAAYAVYGGVMALAAASTGTPIAALSGVAAYNATLAAIGGGSLAAGGFGMAGGAAILGGVVAAPILAIAGWAYASHAEKALEHAYTTQEQVNDAIEKMELAKTQFRRTRSYVRQIHAATEDIYSVFKKYFSHLKEMNDFIERGGNLDEIEDKVIQIIENGYMVAAILTDVITTPLFKPKTNSKGEVILGENQAAEIETDEHGMQVLNGDAIENALKKAENDVVPYERAA